jgi:predicted transcriptional regulator
MTEAQPIFDEDEDDLFAVPDEAADEAKIRRALADHAAGRVISNEAIMRWVESWSTDKPLPKPKCGE